MKILLTGFFIIISVYYSNAASKSTCIKCKSDAASCPTKEECTKPGVETKCVAIKKTNGGVFRGCVAKNADCNNKTAITEVVRAADTQDTPETIETTDVETVKCCDGTSTNSKNCNGQDFIKSGRQCYQCISGTTVEKYKCPTDLKSPNSTTMPRKCTDLGYQCLIVKATDGMVYRGCINGSDANKCGGGQEKSSLCIESVTKAAKSAFPELVFNATIKVAALNICNTDECNVEIVEIPIYSSTRIQGKVTTGIQGKVTKGIQGKETTSATTRIYGKVTAIEFYVATMLTVIIKSII